MPKTKPPALDQYKQLLAEAKRWSSLYKQGTATVKAGKLKRAEQLLNELLKVARRFKELQLELAADDAEAIAAADNFVMTANRELGILYWIADPDGVNETCRPYLLEALTYLESAPEPDYDSLFRIYDALNRVYAASKEWAKNEDLCRRTLALKEREVGQWDIDIVRYLVDLAFVLEEQRKYDEALAIKKDAYNILLNALGPADHEVIGLKHGVACTTLLSQGKTQLESIQKALATLTEEERKIFTGDVAKELMSMR